MEQARDVGGPELRNGGVIGDDYKGSVRRRILQERVEEAVGHFVGFAVGAPALSGVLFAVAGTGGIHERQEDMVDVIEYVDVGIE